MLAAALSTSRKSIMSWMLRNQVVKDPVALSNKDSTVFPCDDYRECADNTLIVFGETSPRGIHFMKPGTTDQARWMAHNLYASKMFMPMFSKAMAYSDEMVEKLMRMNRFVALFYTSAWMKATMTLMLQRMIFTLLTARLIFVKLIKHTANMVTDKLDNHRWYLTQEVVPFALFSKAPDDDWWLESRNGD